MLETPIKYRYCSLTVCKLPFRDRNDNLGEKDALGDPPGKLTFVLFFLGSVKKALFLFFSFFLPFFLFLFSILYLRLSCKKKKSFPNMIQGKKIRLGLNNTFPLFICDLCRRLLYLKPCVPYSLNITLNYIVSIPFHNVPFPGLYETSPRCSFLF